MKDKVITGAALYNLEAYAQSVIAHTMFDEMQHYKENSTFNKYVGLSNTSNSITFKDI